MNNISLKKEALGLPLQISELARLLTMALVLILSFFVPFVVGHPQWLVGTIVNACLFLGAIYLPKKYFIPLAILPSLGVLVRGIVFGPMTMFLVYFLPFIWMGNFLLIYIFKFIYNFKYTANSAGAKNGAYKFFAGFAGASLGKFVFLFLVANIYFNFGVVPAIFLQAMGLFQLFTALAGGAIAFIIYKSIKYGK